MPWGKAAGLDLDDDGLDGGEYEKYAFERCAHLGFPNGMPIWELFRHYRPELIKSHLRNLLGGPEGWSPDLHDVVSMLDFHLYIIRQYTHGVHYELVGYQNMGWTRAEMMDTIAVVNLQAVSMGLNDSVSAESISVIRNWRDPAEPPKHFPADWSTDRELLKSGIDYSEPGMTDSEVKLLEDWYMRVAGEIPAWIPHLAEYDRNWLKTVRMRWEQALQVQPVQMLPMYLVHYDMLRGFADGIRENTLIAKGLGVRKDLYLAAMHFGGKTYGGTGPISLLSKTVGDVLRDW